MKLTEKTMKLYESQLKAKFSKLFDVVDDDAPDLVHDAVSVVEYKLPNGETIFEVVAKKYNIFYSLKNGWVGTKEDGLDGKYSKFTNELEDYKIKETKV